MIKPAAIFFDWDGTLVDTLPGILIAHNHVRNVHGLPPWSQTEFAANLKYSSREIFPKIYGDRMEKALQTLDDYLLAHHLDHLEVLAEAEMLVRFIHACDIPMGVVSNKRQHVIDREIDHLGWRDMFYCVLGSGAAARDKPAGDPIILALEHATAPLNPAEVWFVGDTVSDLAAAREAGCPTVLVTHGENKAALIAEFAPALVVPNCAALIGAVRRATQIDP